MSEKIVAGVLNKKISRRAFVAGTAIGCSALLMGDSELSNLYERAKAGVLTPEDVYILNQSENAIASTGLQCNTGCAIYLKLLEGKPVKIDGNGYSPTALY
ncbi:MAG: hypothetical protein N2491_13405, partial [Negativicutes bacterium]|nr:hypothetical protein [Negativicutes bacterium]